MSGGLAFGVDIGTTATKAVLLDPQAGLLAACQAPSGLHSPRPGWAEEDAGRWWDNVGTLARECLQGAGRRAADVAAVGVSGMVPAVLLLDARGRVLRPSIQQNDVRATVEIGDFRAATDAADVLARTGSPVSQQSVGPKLLWLRRHEPQIMHRASAVMGSYDFIVQRLTGEHCAERNWALESGLYDLSADAWDARLLELATISASALGRLRWPAEVVGEVSRTAARHTGLRAGTPVVAGSADHVASAFSAGLKAPGDALVKLGGSGDILVSVDAPLVDARLYLDHHVIPGKFILNGCMASSGSLIQWFRDTLASGADYARLDAEGAAVAPGSEGLVVLPYFLGEKTPLNDPLARGVFFGLGLNHGRGHLFRAVLEGIAYGFRHHLEVLAERGVRPGSARVTNGGARSLLWKQVTADVLDLPLEVVTDHPGSSLGAAFIAGRGVGLFDAWSDMDRFVCIGSRVEPRPQFSARYAGLYTVYRELYRRTHDLMAGLGDT